MFDFLLTYIDVEFYQRETLQSLDTGKEISWVIYDYKLAVI